MKDNNFKDFGDVGKKNIFHIRYALYSVFRKRGKAIKKT